MIDSWSERLRALGTIAADLVFLVLWAVAQSAAELVLKHLELSGVDQWILAVLRLIFGVSTLFWVVWHLYIDVRVTIMRGQKRLRQYERQLQ